jgi:hypothetical protein
MFEADWSTECIIPFESREIIKGQLQNGNMFELTPTAWNFFTRNVKDIRGQMVKFYAEEDGNGKGKVYIKVTNDARRLILRKWSFI